MSKAHPQMSDEYIVKQKIRNERAEERQLLRESKEIYYTIFSGLSVTHRSKLAQIK